MGINMLSYVLIFISVDVNVLIARVGKGSFSSFSHVGGNWEKLFDENWGYRLKLNLLGKS